MDSPQKRNIEVNQFLRTAGEDAGGLFLIPS
jgi:hypothetical protein